jgi:hypothetical protein
MPVSAISIFFCIGIGFVSLIKADPSSFRTVELACSEDESRTWERAAKYPTIGNFEQYLRCFPEGEHISLVKVFYQKALDDEARLHRVPDPKMIDAERRIMERKKKVAE